MSAEAHSIIKQLAFNVDHAIPTTFCNHLHCVKVMWANLSGDACVHCPSPEHDVPEGPDMIIQALWTFVAVGNGVTLWSHRPVQVFDLP